MSGTRSKAIKRRAHEAATGIGDAELSHRIAKTFKRLWYRTPRPARRRPPTGDRLRQLATDVRAGRL